MTTKEDLLFAREFAHRQRNRDRVLERIREAVDVKSPQFDKIMASGGEQHDRMAEHVVRMDEATRQWVDETIEDRERYVRICQDIGRLSSKEMEVITMRYLEWHSWGWIRRRLHYSEREIFRVHKHALAMLAVVGS